MKKFRRRTGKFSNRRFRKSRISAKKFKTKIKRVIRSYQEPARIRRVWTNYAPVGTTTGWGYYSANFFRQITQGNDKYVQISNTASTNVTMRQGNHIKAKRIGFKLYAYMGNMVYTNGQWSNMMLMYRILVLSPRKGQSLSDLTTYMTNFAAQQYANYPLDRAIVHVHYDKLVKLDTQSKCHAEIKWSMNCKGKDIFFKEPIAGGAGSTDPVWDYVICILGYNPIIDTYAQYIKFQGYEYVSFVE